MRNKRNKRRRRPLKKPFYKKAWFWIIVVIVLVAGFKNDSQKNTPESITPMETIKSESTMAPTNTDTLALNTIDSTNEPTSTENTGSLEQYNEPYSAASDNIEQIDTDSSGDVVQNSEVLNGRGISDSGRSEPNYVGHKGYATIYASFSHSTDECLKTPWFVQTYQKDKQFWIEAGSIEHKTEIEVLSQELKHEGWGRYSGYLLVQRIDNGEQFYINVSNFITRPYWTYNDLLEATRVGDFIAEFKQTSNYYPVDKSNNKVDLPDGMKVFVVGPTGTYGRGGPDRDTNQIEAIVFKEWKYGYGGVSVFFNVKDLTISY